MTPYLANTFCLTDDEQYDLKAASFYSYALPCPYQCTVCPPLIKEEPKFLDIDDFHHEVQRYRLAGVELFLIRGYEPTLNVSAHIPHINILKEYAPIRVHSNGQRLPALNKLVANTDGVCLDIKVAPLVNFSYYDLEIYNRLLPLNEVTEDFLVDYRDSMLDAIKVVDGMQFTYFTSTTFDWLPPIHQESILSLRKYCKSPFVHYAVKNYQPIRSV